MSYSGRKSNCQFDFRPFIGHNLCFNHPNKSCEPILDIYVPRVFQWFKDFDNLIGFDPYNWSLKIWEFIGTSIPKVGAHLGMWGFIPSHSPTLLGAWDVTSGLPSWCAPLPWSRAQGQGCNNITIHPRNLVHLAHRFWPTFNWKFGFINISFQANHEKSSF